MPTLIRQDIRITLVEFALTPTLLPGVPPITQVSDTWAVLDPAGQPLPGNFGTRRATYAVSPGQMAAALAAFMADLCGKVPGLVGTQIVQNADGSNAQTFDRIWVDSPVTITPAFDPATGQPVVRDFLLTLRYSRHDVTGSSFGGIEALTLPIGAAGWNLDLAGAANLIAAKRAAIKAKEGLS